MKLLILIFLSFAVQADDQQTVDLPKDVIESCHDTAAANTNMREVIYAGNQSETEVYAKSLGECLEQNQE